MKRHLWRRRWNTLKARNCVCLPSTWLPRAHLRISGAQQTDKLLEGERKRSETLAQQVTRLEYDHAQASERVVDLISRERDLSEKKQDVERELELTKRNANDLKIQLSQQRNRVRQLEEQIQNDDRLDQMEKSMKGIQDRAESLEFQLSKVKQVKEL